MSGIVHCRQCRAKGIGAVPDTPPAGWILVLANRVYGGGACLAFLCRLCGER
jgi:hypothetical protein